MIVIPVERPDRTRVAAATVRGEDQSAAGKIQRVRGNDVARCQLHEDLTSVGDRNPAVDRGDLDGRRRRRSRLRRWRRCRRGRGRGGGSVVPPPQPAPTISKAASARRIRFIRQAPLDS